MYWKWDGGKELIEKTDFSFAAAPSLIEPLVCNNNPSGETISDPVKTVKNCLVNVIVEHKEFSTIAKVQNYFRWK